MKALIDPARWPRRLFRFVPPPPTVGHLERWRAVGFALLAILICGLVTHALLGPALLPWLVASMGAASVIIFAMPSSPVGQPWALVGGQMVSALIGVASLRWLGPWLPLELVAALAVALSIAAMLYARCLHPPGGATALTAVFGGDAVVHLGFGFVWMPVLVNALILLAVALIANNSVRGRRYPLARAQENPHGTRDPVPTARVGLREADLDAAMRELGEMVDVSAEELGNIVARAERHAYARQWGELDCSQLMSRDLVTLPCGALASEAWALLRRHRIGALPVIDPETGRIAGVVALVDFLKHIEADNELALPQHRHPGLKVDSLMSRDPVTVSQATPVHELVPLMADRGLHRLPVVDDDGRLVGMVTQSDLIAALSQQGMSRS
ncbi:HPP family protein [Jeongeupia naejangsanensis]|uniref:HPP family protein n=1 Tax=Jeongeupia naejangsanensis TaxID=613195 RepID=A0ABS2BHY1_9NEIS|nr:HPP family protein [Jeongeupia naejangsanensis]MBM3115213.1 HPP family protein [Jeongeupia naejangsanensis]